MGFTVSSYTPPMFPGVQIQNVYVCLDLGLPIRITRSTQNSTCYSLTGKVLIFLSQEARVNGQSIDSYTVNLEGIDPSQDLCSLVYKYAKIYYTSLGQGITTTDVQGTPPVVTTS